jgi:serine/threonine-protein kinase
LPSLAGTKLAKYDVLEEVGHGGMAVVYRGLDTVLKREVAIKVLHPHLADRPESRKRLEREAVAVAALRHENILEIFDSSGDAAGESYIVTEFIHGPTLREWLENGYHARPAIAALVVHRLALALVHAHKASIVHRDIKPENVMIRRDDGCIKLMDFGIAQILDNQKLTMTGQLIGSPAYMAPELINGRPLDARTDLFSLGILLYQLATGELPFAGRNPHEVLNRIADGNYAAPSTVNPLVDSDLESILAKALATNPDDRYQSAEAMATQLEQYLAEMDLEPSAAELRTYFQDAEVAIADLDARVSKALMTRAVRAAQEGLHARALRLLGRVLEHDKSNKEARTMLARLRVRARRMRQLMLGAAALGLVGLVVAGAVLLPGDPFNSTIASADAQPLPDTADRGTSLGSLPVQPVEEPLPTSTPGPVASTMSGDPLPDADPTGVAATDGETGRKPSGKPIARPPIPARTPMRTECSIVLDGIPLSTARNLKLKIRAADGTESSTPIESLTTAIDFPGAEANVSIDDGPWRATKRITRPDCAPGSSVTLSVKPKPAKLTFTGAPNDLAVTCEEGCPADLAGLGADRTAMADRFPQIPFDAESNTRRVTLLLKHEDFKPKTVTTTLHPGPNKIPLELEPRTPG